MIAGTKFCVFWAYPQKYQTLVPAKNSLLKVPPVTLHIILTLCHFVLSHTPVQTQPCLLHWSCSVWTVALAEVLCDTGTA